MQFAGVSLSMFNTKIQRFTIDQIMKKLTGDGFDPKILLANYKVVMNTYDQAVKANLSDPINLLGIT